jgi:methionine sulfoxide reductase heme-binding subunit
MRSVWGRVTALLAAITHWRFFKPAVFLACLAPGLLLGYDVVQFATGRDAMALGVDPIKTLEHETGEDALGILFVTLAVTPVRRTFGVNKVQLVRRMLGVWSFTYAVVHVSIYLVFDQNCYSFMACEYHAVWEDILKRKFIFAGMTGFSVLAVLAMTSTQGWMRRLRKNWLRIHRFVYLAGIAGVVHFIWIQKSDIGEPLNWAFWLAGLFGVRVFFAVRRRRAVAKAA